MVRYYYYWVKRLKRSNYSNPLFKKYWISFCEWWVFFERSTDKLLWRFRYRSILKIIKKHKWVEWIKFEVGNESLFDRFVDVLPSEAIMPCYMIWDGEIARIVGFIKNYKQNILKFLQIIFYYDKFLILYIKVKPYLIKISYFLKQFFRVDIIKIKRFYRTRIRLKYRVVTCYFKKGVFYFIGYLVLFLVRYYRWYSLVFVCFSGLIVHPEIFVTVYNNMYIQSIFGKVLSTMEWESIENIGELLLKDSFEVLGNYWGDYGGSVDDGGQICGYAMEDLVKEKKEVIISLLERKEDLTWEEIWNLKKVLWEKIKDLDIKTVVELCNDHILNDDLSKNDQYKFIRKVILSNFSDFQIKCTMIFLGVLSIATLIGLAVACYWASEQADVELHPPMHDTGVYELPPRHVFINFNGGKHEGGVITDIKCVNGEYVGGRYEAKSAKEYYWGTRWDMNMKDWDWYRHGIYSFDDLFTMDEEHMLDVWLPDVQRRLKRSWYPDRDYSDPIYSGERFREWTKKGDPPRDWSPNRNRPKVVYLVDSDWYILKKLDNWFGIKEYRKELRNQKEEEFLDNFNKLTIPEKLGYEDNKYKELMKLVQLYERTYETLLLGNIEIVRIGMGGKRREWRNGLFGGGELTDFWGKDKLDEEYLKRFEYENFWNPGRRQAVLSYVVWPEKLKKVGKDMIKPNIYYLDWLDKTGYAAKYDTVHIGTYKPAIKAKPAVYYTDKNGEWKVLKSILRSRFWRGITISVWNETCHIVKDWEGHWVWKGEYIQHVDHDPDLNISINKPDKRVRFDTRPQVEPVVDLVYYYSQEYQEWKWEKEWNLKPALKNAYGYRLDPSGRGETPPEWIGFSKKLERRLFGIWRTARLPKNHGFYKYEPKRVSFDLLPWWKKKPKKGKVTERKWKKEWIKNSRTFRKLEGTISYSDKYLDKN